jgi:hypothetical protein
MLNILDCEMDRLDRMLGLAQISDPQYPTLRDKTTYIVIGDNGTAGLSHWPPGHLKGTVYEGGVRVPLIVGGKEVENTTGDPRESMALINTTDVFATALELMGVNLSTALSGITHDSSSFLPAFDSAFQDSVTAFRPRVYVEEFACGPNSDWEQAIRDAQYKLIRKCPPCPGGGCCYTTPCDEEIYAVSDVLECCDLAGDPTAESYANTNLRPYLPEEVLCKPGDACKGCCADSHCAAPGTCAINAHQCCPSAPDTTGIKVEWLGPPSDPGPQLNTDYAVRNWLVDGVCLPAVELNTTKSGPTAVDLYRVGRGGLDLGAVTTLWNTTPGTFNIPVQVGQVSVANLRIADLDSVDIAPESPGQTWSSARLELTGDLITRAKVSASAGNGGRIAGVVAGAAQRIEAYAIGKNAGGAGDGDTLQLGAITGDLLLDRIGTGSKLVVPGTLDSPGRIIVTNPIDRPLIIAGSFSGTLCAPNLLGLDNKPSLPVEILLAFAADGSGLVCENPPICSGPSPACYLMSEGLSLAAPTAEPAGVSKSRYISFGVPGGTGLTAIRVTATVLDPPAADPAQFAQFELDQCSAIGEGIACLRWVNALGGTPTCPETTSGTFKCATLGCDPEYRDWGADLGGSTLHVTDHFVVPESTYQVQLIRQSDRRSSATLTVTTGLWADAAGPANGPPDGARNVIDIAVVVDGVKQLAAALPKSRLQVRHDNRVVDPTLNVNVLDIAGVVDAVAGRYFKSTVDVCP